MSADCYIVVVVTKLTPMARWLLLTTGEPMCEGEWFVTVGDGSGAEGLKRLVEGFGDDLAPAAKEVADLLAAIEAGEDAKDRAQKLLERLPSLLPDDPAAAAVLAEEMAKAIASLPAAPRKESAKDDE